MSVIRKIPFLNNNFSEAVLEKLANHFKESVFAKDEVIVAEG